MKTITNFNMYGCDIDEFIEDITDSVTYRVSGASMIVAGLMSDAQELLALGENEQARKTLNCAKAILFKIMDGELVGTVERV
jgi:hypothetical protein